MISRTKWGQGRHRLAHLPQRRGEVLRVLISRVAVGAIAFVAVVVELLPVRTWARRMMVILGMRPVRLMRLGMLMLMLIVLVVLVVLPARR